MNKTVEKFQKAAEIYLNDMECIGKSDKTILDYSRVLGYFQDYLVKQDAQEDPSVSTIRAWRDELMKSGLAISSIRHYLIVLRAFFTYASDSDVFEDGTAIYERNPVSKRIMPLEDKEAKKPYTKVLDAEDIASLWANERKGVTNRNLWARNYAIITLLLDGKIRNAELLDLKLSDVHFADDEDPFNYVTIVKGKGNKYREVDLNEISASAIQLYLKSGVRPEGLSDEDYLFGTTAEKKKGGNSYAAGEWHRGSSQWLSKLVEQHVKDVTGKEGFRSHSMRHNGAMFDLNTGSSMEEIQSELGHASMNTTQIYAGRLMARRNRHSMQAAVKARDEWGQRNLELLASNDM